LATVQDLFSRRMLGFAQSDSHPTAELAVAALNMAAATRGADIDGVIFHTDKGTQYTSGAFAEACRRLGAAQSMGRVGCALDNAAAESFFSTLQHELISRRRWRTRHQARQDIADWIHTRHNPKRLHPTNNTTSQRSPNQPSKKQGEAHPGLVPVHGGSRLRLLSDFLTVGIKPAIAVLNIAPASLAFVIRGERPGN